MVLQQGQGRQRRYGRYGHGLTKIPHILLEINHTVSKKTISTIVSNEWPCKVPSHSEGSEVAAEVDYSTHHLID